MSLTSGCYQILEVESGTNYTRAEDICRQFGAVLVSKQSLSQSKDLVTHYTNVVMTRDFHHTGRAYWLADTSNIRGTCTLWTPDHGPSLGHLATNNIGQVRCHVTTLYDDNIIIHPLCQKINSKAGKH